MQIRQKRFWIVLFLLAVGVLGCVQLVSTPAQADRAKDEISKKQAIQEKAACEKLARGSTCAVVKAPAFLSAEELCDRGFQEAIRGEFALAIKTLTDANKLTDGSGVKSAAGIKLLTAYVQDKEQVDTQRAEEYSAAVVRVKRGLMVISYLPELMKTETGKSLRKILMEYITDAHNDAAVSLAVKRASVEEFPEMKTGTIKALASAEGQLRDAIALLKVDKSDYAVEFRKLAEIYSTHLGEYRKVWKEAKIGAIDDRKQVAASLQVAERAVAQALVDLDAMISEYAWRVTIDQARLAKDLAPADENVSDEFWYKQTICEIELVAKQARADAKWYDVLGAYARLKEIEPDNKQYAELEKRAQRHVRVLRLYGTDEETKKADKDSWKKYVEGIDARLVADSIPSIQNAYVTGVDYRKLICGALKSVTVLAETPQVIATFDGMKDEKQLKSFLSRIDKMATSFENKKSLNHSDLQLALSKVLMASELTVEIPTGVLTREFAEGFLSELDKFTSMIWPHGYQDFRKSMLGKFYGVGIQIGKEQGRPLRVSTPLAGSPAFKAGIKAEDLIVKVDGEETASHDIDELVKRITGKKGTKVVLTIKREGVLKPFDVPVVRDEIKICTIKGWKIDGSGKWQFRIDAEAGIGYIRLTQFTGDTHKDLAAALGELKRKGVHSLVLDLRFNPGGLLSSAQEVSNEFLDSRLIVSTRGRSQPLTNKRADDSGHFLRADGDLVVLVNSFSASAAEIVSGALKDWKRCVVVGDRSYGKGSVQNVIPVRYNRAILKLTTAYYYLPSGRLLHRKSGAKTWGVDPDISVPMTPEQLRKWLNIRNKTDLLIESNTSLEKDLAKQLDADIQLKTALLILELMKLQSKNG